MTSWTRESGRSSVSWRCLLGASTLEAAEAVCHSARDPAIGAGQTLAVEVLDGLESLVSKSLVRPQEAPGGESRFTLLETIREYALEKLAESGRRRPSGRQHAIYYLVLAEDAQPKLRRATGGVVGEPAGARAWQPACRVGVVVGKWGKLSRGSGW